MGPIIVDKIYRAMLRSGHDIPDYSNSSPTSVILRLNSSEFDEQFVRMLVEEEKKMDRLMPVDALIVLATLKNERRASLPELARKVQKREADTKVTVEWLVELGMVEGIGNGKARRYMLSSKVYALSGDETGYIRQRGMTIIDEMGMIMRHVEKYGRINSKQTADHCKSDLNHANYVLRKMVDKNMLRKGGRGKNTFYTKEDET